jgi:hypothetical protein
VVREKSGRAESTEMVMSLGFAKPLVICNGRLWTTGCPIACVCGVGCAFSPERLREASVNEVRVDQVEDSKVNTHNPSVLSMGIKIEGLKCVGFRLDACSCPIP